MLENTGRTIKKEQSKETGNTGHRRRRKTQRNMYRTPPHPNTHHPTNNWRQRRTKHRFYTETINDITIQNSEQIGEYKKLNR